MVWYCIVWYCVVWYGTLPPRSAVWASLGRPSLVVREVGAALEEGPPRHTRWRLLERRGRALWAQGEGEAAIVDLQEAEVGLLLLLLTPFPSPSPHPPFPSPPPPPAPLGRASLQHPG